MLWTLQIYGAMHRNWGSFVYQFQFMAPKDEAKPLYVLTMAAYPLCEKIALCSLNVLGGFLCSDFATVTLRCFFSLMNWSKV